MFRAVRNWWAADGKAALRLFLFEFVVVVAGVLTAQALASWVGAQAEDRAIREEHARVLYEIGRSRQNARIWMVAAPCLERRVENVIRKSATSENLTADELKPPRFVGYSVEPLSPEMYREFRDRFGVIKVDDYYAIAAAGSAVFTAYREILRGWDRFALVDPALGVPGATDRSTVRDIAIEVRSQIRRLRWQAEAIEQISARLRIAPLTSDSATGTASPVKSCDEIWKTGRIWRE